jgi:hypothetical protein
MSPKVSNFVRAFLPAAALAVCHGCGSDGPTQSSTKSPAAAPAPVNSAPSISGDASAYARVDVAYDYKPTASDRDGDSLKFTADNLPPWATIDAVSGEIRGTPAADDVGAYESISITVADASHKTTSDPFTITVLDAVRGVVSLRWDTPMSKVDGSPLDDLGGYRIVYGRHADDLDHSELIASGDTNELELTNLDSGIWYFAIIAVSSSGLEGPPTTAAMKSI